MMGTSIDLKQLPNNVLEVTVQDNSDTKPSQASHIPVTISGDYGIAMNMVGQSSTFRARTIAIDLSQGLIFWTSAEREYGDVTLFRCSQEGYRGPDPV